MYPTRDGEESIDKKIAKVEHKANGKIDITYMVLADNRSTKYNGTTIHTTNTYDDFLSGLPAGAAKLVIPDPGKRDGVRIYKIPATYNPDDPTGWTLREAHSVEELDKSENGYLLITDPLTDRNQIPGEWWGGVTRERMDENGFNLYVPYSYTINEWFKYIIAQTQKGESYDSKFWAKRAFDHIYDVASGYDINWSQYPTADDFYNNYDFSKMTKSSFYFVYTVEVDEELLNQNDILRNTINRYTGNSITGSSYQDYAILLNELRKNITEKPTAKNNYTVSYQLDVKMTEKLKALDTYTITDKLSDNQELDVQTLRIYKVNADGTETLLPSQPPAEGSGAYYTSMYTDHNLVIAMNKGEEDWADQYAIRYEAYLTDYEGRVQYDNEARIPDGEDIPHSTKGEVFVKRPEGQVTHLAVEIYKYDGNNTAQSLAGAKFKLLRLSEEKQAELKALAGESSTTQETIDTYLAGLSDGDWTQFGEEKTTGADGKAGFGTWRDSAGEAHSILFNQVYKLQETSVPAGYSDAQLKPQYFMFYTTNLPSHADVDGVEKYVRSFAPDTASFQIPNYKTSFRVYKVDADDTAKKLTGVRFGLFANAACTQPVTGYQYPNGEPAAEGYIYYPDIPVPVSGTATYYLKEMQAPESYLLDPNRVFVVNVTSEGQISFEEKVWVKSEEDTADGTLRDLTAGETPAKISADAIGITVANKPNKTTFEFNKEWLFGGEKKAWPDEVKEITVTLTRTCQPSGKDKVTQSVTFTVPKVMTGEISLKEITGSQISGKVTQTVAGTDNTYTYRITDLEDVAFGNTAEKDGALKWTYTITEAQVDGYEMPKYVPKDAAEPDKKADAVGSGGTIRNEQTDTGTVLPGVGGPGTAMFYLMGAILVIAAGLWKMVSGRKRYS